MFLASGCGTFFFQGNKHLYFPPDENGFHPKEIYFETVDHAKLHGWLFLADEKKPKNSKGLIVQFHGNAENISSHYASLVWLTKKGYNLFIFDYRGYGLSAGEANQEKVYKDGMAALDEGWKLHQLYSNNKKFIVYGQSLGGLVAMRAFADFSHQAETSLVVLDSTFCSYKDLVQEKLAQTWLTFIFSPLGRLSVSDKFASEPVLKRFQNNILVIHDKKDRVVDIKNGRKIYDNIASKQKEFWELTNGYHVGVFALVNMVYRDKFLAKLESL